MGEDGGHYIHGTDPEEQRRLSLLNALLNEASLGALALARGDVVLDVGSGLGQLSRAMARVVGSDGRVVGVERDPDQISEARHQADEQGETDLVEFRRGEAVDLPLADDEWGAFDVAHARFLLEHVPDPDAVVAAMVRAVAPGGRVVLEDDDHDLLRLWPEVPNFSRLWRAYLRTYDQLGNDPHVGRRLVSMLKGAGAQPVRNDLLFFGSCSGNPSFEAFVANFVGLIEGAPETILDNSSLTRDELDEALEAFRAWGRCDDAAIWYATCWAEGRRVEETPEAAGAKARREPPSRARQTVSSMAFLAESAADLTSSLRLDEVFRKIADRVQQLVDCHLFCVMLWNEQSQLLEHSYSVRFGEHIEQQGGFPLGYGLSGTAAAERRAIRVPDVSKDERYVRFRHAEVEIRSELAVPLVVRDRLVGALDLESLRPDAFSEEHVQIVMALASHIATALENARLYEELTTREKLLERDLEMAREIQKGLLPTQPPKVVGLEIGAAFAPARELSGDFYDFLRYPDGRVAFVVGDVAGKSTAAALYGSMAVGLLRGHLLEHYAEPAELLHHLNNHLHSLEVGRRFVAMVFAVWDPAESTLTIANAGCPQPYLAGDDGIRSIELAGLPVGGLADSHYQVETVRLAPGDVVLFCSDGIEDCESPKGEVLSERKLPEFLATVGQVPAQEIADNLIALTILHTGIDIDISDDRTAVVLRRN